MDVLKIDGTAYIWYAAGIYPYTIDLTESYPVAKRNFSIKESSEYLQKTGAVEIIKWENVPLRVQNCIISLHEILVSEGFKKQLQRNDK
jgi:hypothetical protein